MKLIVLKVQSVKIVWIWFRGVGSNVWNILKKIGYYLDTYSVAVNVSDMVQNIAN